MALFDESQRQSREPAQGDDAWLRARELHESNCFTDDVKYIRGGVGRVEPDIWAAHVHVQQQHVHAHAHVQHAHVHVHVHVVWQTFT